MWACLDFISIQILSFCFQSPYALKKVNVDEPVSVCMSLANDSSKTIEPIIVTWHSDCHRYLNASHLNYTDLDLQCHTDLNHENNKCSIISETVQSPSSLL